MPGIAFIAAAFGAGAVEKGLSFAEALAVSAFVFAGASQMVALELWQQSWTIGGLATVVTVTAVINARMILMGAAIQPWLARERRGRLALNLAFLTDASWLIGTRYHAEGGRDLGVLYGAGVAIWAVWVAGTIPGFLIGSLLPDPRRFGLDLTIPVFFSVMLVPLWKGPRHARSWVVAGVVAVLVHALLPGYAFIVAGALAGALAAALLPE